MNPEKGYFPRGMWGWGHPQLNPGAEGMLKEITVIASAPAEYQYGTEYTELLSEK